MLSSKPDNSQSKTFPLALVTGAGHRLGKSFAMSLAQQGFAIGLHFHKTAAEIFETRDEIAQLGVPVFPLQADLAAPLQISNLFSTIDSILENAEYRISNLQVLINSAAIMPRADARNMSLEEFDAVINLNLRAPFACAQMAFQRMKSGGLIVNISDIAAQKAWIGFPAYTVSKAGLDSLTKILARSFAPSVRVNAIAPGLVLPSDDMLKEEWVRLIKRIPNQRAATLNEITSPLEFLLKNEYITGQTIAVDGGYSLV